MGFHCNVTVYRLFLESEAFVTKTGNHICVMTDYMSLHIFKHHIWIPISGDPLHQILHGPVILENMCTKCGEVLGSWTTNVRDVILERFRKNSHHKEFNYWNRSTTDRLEYSYSFRTVHFLLSAKSTTTTLTSCYLSALYSSKSERNADRVTVKILAP